MTKREAMKYKRTQLQGKSLYLWMTIIPSHHSNESRVIAKRNIYNIGLQEEIWRDIRSSEKIKL